MGRARGLTFNHRIHIFGRFSRFTDLLSGNTLFGAAGGSGLGLAGYGGTSERRQRQCRSGTDIVITPTLVTDIRLGYFRYNILTGKYDPTNKTSLSRAKTSVVRV